MFETMLRNLTDDEIINWCADDFELAQLSFTQSTTLIKELSNRLETAINSNNEET